MLISVVIRTLNEEIYLEEILHNIQLQELLPHQSIEVVIVDSGSTDRTLQIAQAYKCRVTHIKQEEFTFGRSLNIGCNFSEGEVLIFISGHCVPADKNWIQELVKPISEGRASYVYGRQIGRDATKFSEKELFKKYFPDNHQTDNFDFFCNNANSALLKSVWKEYMFDEMLTGLEDMELAKRINSMNHKILYSHKAIVFHIHDESWIQTKRRYERESLALKEILPEIQVSIFDFIRFFLVSIYLDLVQSLKEEVFANEILGIIKFRLAQYLGTYLGNKRSKEISQERKNKYFYP